MGTESVKNFSAIAERIEQGRNRFQLLRCVIHFLKAISVLILLLCICAALMYVIQGIAVKIAFFLSCAVSAAFTYVYYPKSITKTQFAKKFDQNTVSLQSAVELFESYETLKGISFELVDVFLETAEKTYESTDFMPDIYGFAKQAAVYLIVLFCGFFLLLHSPVRYGIDGIIQYEFSVSPGNIVCEKGTDITFSVEYKNIAASQASIFFQPSGSNSVQKKNMDGNIYVMKNVQFSCEYWVVINEKSISDKYTVTAESVPVIESISAGIFYPEYTGLQPVVQTKTGDIEAVYGTQTRLEVSFSRAVRSARINTGTGEITMDFSDGRYSQGFSVDHDFEYEIFYTDNTGKKLVHPVKYSVHCLEDASPEITIISPSENLALRPEDRVDITFQATDDFFVSRVRFCYSLNNISYTMLPVPVSGRKTVASFPVDFHSLGLTPGMRLWWYMEAYDNNPHRPSRGVSARYFAEIISPGAEISQARDEYEKISAELQSIVEKQKEIQEQASDVLQKTPAEKKMDWENTREFERLMKEQETVIEEAEAAAEKLKEFQKKFENSSISSEISDKLQQLNSLANELLSNEMKEMMNSLQKLASEITLSASDRQEMMNKFQSQEYAKKLDRMIEMLKRIKYEQELEALSSLFEKTAEHQQTARDINLGSEKDLATQAQKGVNDEYVTLRDIMEKSEFPDEIREKIEEFKSEYMTKDLSEKMVQTLNQIEAGNKENALEQQSEILQKLNNASEHFAALRKDYLNKSKQKLLQKLFRIFGNLAALAGEQQNVSEETITAASAGKQYALGQYAQIAVNDVFGLMNESFLINQNIASNLFSMIQNIEKYKELYSDNQTNLSYLQKSALKNCNYALYYIAETMEKIQKASSAMGFEEMLKQMEKMARQQKSLADSTETLMQNLQDQDMLSSMYQQMMKQMAFEQQMLGSQMQKLADGFSGAQEVSDKLNAIARQMAEIERKLASGTARRPIADEQRKLVERMLDVQKSLHTQDSSESYRSQSAQQEFFNDIPDIAPAVTKEFLKGIQDKSSDKIPEYAELIKRYFKAVQSGGIQ